MPKHRHRPLPPKEKGAVLEAKKSLGQNFLTSDIVPGWMADAATIIKGDIVLEIGPGTGVLTAELLKRGAVVYAIETDSRAIHILENTFASEVREGRLHLIEADIRTYDLSCLPLQTGSYKVVANIPYYLSGFLLRIILEHPHHPNTLVFLMQKEIVERIARSKKESLLSLSVKAFGTAKFYKAVSRGHFRPVPKVDSAILQVTTISHEAFRTPSYRKHFFTLLHLGFGQKRKQLYGNLRQVYQTSVIDDAFTQAHISKQSRAEDISLPQWHILAATFPQLS